MEAVSVSVKPPPQIHRHTIRGFYWDHPDAKKPRGKHNVYHMLDKHRVTPDEVEEVLEGAPVVLDVPVSFGKNPVYAVVGFTANGRLLEVHGIVLLDPPFDGMWRTITAMDADGHAKRRYEKERGGR